MGMFPRLQGHQQFSIVVMWHTAGTSFGKSWVVTDPMQDTVLSMWHACINWSDHSLIFASWPVRSFQSLEKWPSDQVWAWILSAGSWICSWQYLLASLSKFTSTSLVYRERQCLPSLILCFFSSWKIKKHLPKYQFVIIAWPMYNCNYCTYKSGS